MEVKIWMDGYQRIVCGVTEQTTCQDVIVTLAQASGTTGRYAMYERWKTLERRLPPTERPLTVLQRWGEYSNDVQLIIRHYGQGQGGGKRKPGPKRAEDSERSVLSGGTSLKKSLTFTGTHRRSRSMDQWSDSRVGVRDYSRNVESLGRTSVASRGSETPSPRASLDRQDGSKSGTYRLCTRRLSATERKQSSVVEYPKVSETVAALKSPKGSQRRIFYVNSKSEYVAGSGGGSGSVGAGGSGGGSSGGAGSAFCAGGVNGGSGGPDAGVIKGHVSMSKTIADKEQVLSFSGTNMAPTAGNVADASRSNSAASVLRTISNRSTSNALPFSTQIKILSDRLKKNPNNRPTNRNMSQTNSPIMSSSEKASTPSSKSVEFSNNYCPIKDENVAELVDKTKLQGDSKIKDTKHRKFQRTAHDLLYPTVTSNNMSVREVNFCNLRNNCHATGVSNTSYKDPPVENEGNPVRSVESFAKPAHQGIREEERALREVKQWMALKELIEEQDRELSECKWRLRQLNCEILLLEGKSVEDEKLEEIDRLSVELKLDMKRQRESKPQTELERLAAELLQANVESEILDRELESVKQKIGSADRCLSRRREDLAELERQLKGFNLNLFLKRHITATTHRRGLPSVAVSAKTLPRLQWSHLCQQFPLLQ